MNQINNSFLQFFQLNMFGGTIFIDKIDNPPEIFDPEKYSYKKGRSNPEQNDFYFKNSKVEYDINFSWKTTSFNEAMIIYYILEETGVHHSHLKPHIEYKYLIAPEPGFVNKELSFNLLEFLTETDIKSDKYNCKLITNPKYETETDKNQNIYISNLWCQLELNTKELIVQCMALSIHYRIDQQYHFWNSYFNYTEEQEKLDKEHKETITALKLLEITIFSTTSIETFISHNDVIFKLYESYLSVINKDKNYSSLIDILEGKKTIATNDAKWTKFYNNHPDCEQCLYILREQQKEREEEVHKENERIKYFQRLGTLDMMPINLLEGRLYVPNSISSSVNDLFKIKVLNNTIFSVGQSLLNKINRIIENVKIQNNIDKYRIKKELIIKNIEEKKRDYKIEKNRLENILRNIKNTKRQTSLKNELNDLEKTYLMKLIFLNFYLNQISDNLGKFMLEFEKRKIDYFDSDKIKFNNKQIIKIEKNLKRFSEIGVLINEK